MSEKRFDFVIATQLDFLHPASPDWYVQQVLEEDSLLMDALCNRKRTAIRAAWDGNDFDWSVAKNVIIRATWNYSARIQEYSDWLKQVSMVSNLINPIETVLWNLDKHYLYDLDQKGIPIPPTHFIDKGPSDSLHHLTEELGWNEFVIKPAVSGGGRHTYRIQKEDAHRFEPTFQTLVRSEPMILQEFQHNILSKGEITLVCFGGKYSHAIRKFAKENEFRVQDDFGGRVEQYAPTSAEIALAELAMQSISPVPIYGRVDMMWDNDDRLCVSELELIEPELWLRFEKNAAQMFTKSLVESNVAARQ